MGGVGHGHEHGMQLILQLCEFMFGLFQRIAEAGHFPEYGIGILSGCLGLADGL